MSDQQNPVDENEDDQDQGFDRLLETFRRKSSFGIVQFLFDFWPAWMINPETKQIAPLCRIIVGEDDEGSVLLDKSVVITGVLHLAENLVGAALFNIDRASKTPGFALDVPGGESHFLEIIDQIEGRLKEIRGIVKKNKMFAPDEDDEHK